VKYEGDIMARKVTNSGNWWDKLGKPQYGGEMVLRASRNIENFDPYFSEGLTSIYGGWMERLVADDWTLDPAVWDYKLAWHPTEYLKGQLAESWEFTDPHTHVVHLRKGIHWQDIPPANGREFIADDVVFHYNRLYGKGGGFITPSPFRWDNRFKDLISITAADRYTVVFKFETQHDDFIIDAIHGVRQSQCIANPEAVKKWGDVTDWHHAIGTGPFIFKDFVSDSSAIMVRNPNYWGYDERYPQNKLPYVDAIKYLIIPDDDAAVAAMCAGKIDILLQVSVIQAQSVKKTNPEILQIPTTGGPTVTISPRNDVKPFNDIRVRKAMQMALNLPAIAKDYYHGLVDPYPSTVTSNNNMRGWGFPYPQWPQDLKDEYAYNPVAARKLLADAGYPKGFKTNVVADTVGDMDLLQIIKSYFADIGIDMEIRTMDSADWRNFVEVEHKYDQLCYRPYGLLGHTYPPLRALNRFQTGDLGNFLMVSDPVVDECNARALTASSEEEKKQIVKEYNERVARQHFAISLLQLPAYSLCQPWLKGYHAQCHSIMMGVGGPSRLSFYGARFWIDRKMKSSMGH
jgi:peptide/nickel transport system substrate-binding protein